MFGDETGIIVIPAGKERDVLVKAKEIREEEEKVISKLLSQDID
jgi:regulator of RNase E activity RraA